MSTSDLYQPTYKSELYSFLKAVKKTPQLLDLSFLNLLQQLINAMLQYISLIWKS